MKLSDIRANIRSILEELPDGVMLVAAAKTRTPAEVAEAVSSGVSAIGENYVQEAEEAHKVLGASARWHFIGHLQKNKVKKAAGIFDMIETVDSARLAAEIDNRCAEIGKTMPVLIEVNSGREPQKYGVFPEKAVELAAEISSMQNIKVVGLMTMGPFSGDPEEARPYFRKTRETFDRIRKDPPENVEMKYLSMGMTNSYRVAVEEGANIVRIGTKIFGERHGK